MYFLLVTLVLLPLTSSQAPKWQHLAITYAPNKTEQPLAYSKMPLTKSDHKLTAVGNKNKCNGIFQGYRYKVDSESYSVILLYDVNGYIAGIQISYQASEVDQSNDLKRWFDEHTIFDREKFDGIDYYTITAYLVNPEIICTKGRTKEEFTASPAGNDLYLKNGSQIVTIPKKQSDLEGSSWTLGSCVNGMGQHYWYNMTKDMDCHYFQPFFILYDKGYLSGFDFQVAGSFNSKRFEHPPVDLIIKRMPTCLDKLILELGPTSMHVFLNSDPEKLQCP